MAREIVHIDANALHALMHAAGLSVRALARETGLAYSRLADCRAGRVTRVERTTVETVARTLACDPALLIGAPPTVAAAADPADPARRAGSAPLRLIPWDLLAPPEDNPRQGAELDESGLEELANSILAHGILTPLLVKRLDGGFDGGRGEAYEVIAGHRRWLALRWLIEDDLALPATHPVPCHVVAPASDTDQLLMALAENLARRDMHPLDEALAYHRLRAAGLTVPDMAARLTVSQRTIEGRLSLLTRLSEEAQDALRGGAISLAQAEALATARTPQCMAAVLDRILYRELSTEAQVRQAVQDWTPEPDTDPDEDEDDDETDADPDDADPAAGAPARVVQPYAEGAGRDGAPPPVTSVVRERPGPAEAPEPDGDDSEEAPQSDSGREAWMRQARALGVDVRPFSRANAIDLKVVVMSACSDGIQTDPARPTGLPTMIELGFLREGGAVRYIRADHAKRRKDMARAESRANQAVISLARQLHAANEAGDRAIASPLHALWSALAKAIHDLELEPTDGR